MKHILSLACALLVFGTSAFAKTKKIKADEVPMRQEIQSKHAGSGQYNFRFSPVGLIIGSIAAEMDVAVTPQWTVGPALMYWHLSLSSGSLFSSSFDITAYGIGARANWFKNGN